MDSTRVSVLLDDIAFGQAEATVAAECEDFLLFRPQRASDSPTARMLFVALEREVAEPLLAATSMEDFQKRLVDGVGKFIETRAAYRVLQRQSMVRVDVDVQDWIQRMRQKMESLGGPEQGDEYDFAASTSHRALSLARTLKRLPVSAPRELRLRDRDLILAFGAYNDIFQCVQYVLYAACARDKKADIAVATSSAFEILRGSALNSYATARERVELRKPPESVDVEPLPFDEEDYRLASINT